MKQAILKITKWLLVSVGVLMVSLMFLIGGVYAYYEWFWQEWSPARIERITGVRVPAYKIIEHYNGNRGFTGDYNDNYEVEFKTIPSDELFNEIDKMIDNGGTSWRREGNKYSFSVVWGNGIPAPKGEREEEDRMFSITLTRGKKTGVITSGAW